MPVLSPKKPKSKSAQPAVPAFDPQEGDEVIFEGQVVTITLVKRKSGKYEIRNRRIGQREVTLSELSPSTPPNTKNQPHTWPFTLGVRHEEYRMPHGFGKRI